MEGKSERERTRDRKRERESEKEREKPAHALHEVTLMSGGLRYAFPPQLGEQGRGKSQPRQQSEECEKGACETFCAAARA